MSLWRRNGIYETHVTIDGVRFRRSTGTSNRRLAEQIDRRFKDELIARRSRAAQFTPQMRFAELSAKFIAEGLAKSWHLDRLKLLLPYFADMQVDYITKNTARQYRKERHAKRTLTDTTVNR